jgi:hypothetical protein
VACVVGEVGTEANAGERVEWRERTDDRDAVPGCQRRGPGSSGDLASLSDPSCSRSARLAAAFRPSDAGPWSVPFVISPWVDASANV